LNNLEVRCYSGHTYAERPESLRWQGVEYLVEEIEEAWQESGKRCFRVLTSDNKRFKLCYNETKEQWSLTELVRS